MFATVSRQSIIRKCQDTIPDDQSIKLITAKEGEQPMMIDRYGNVYIELLLIIGPRNKWGEHLAGCLFI